MPKVLAVDADPGALAAYKEIFAGAGFEVRTAGDPVTAMALYQRFQPDLLVLEADMPAGGGQKLFDRLRALFQKAMPVIFAVAPGAADGPGRLANTAVHKKPLDPARLLADARLLLRLP
jgi:DNA-binding response OmpR family regulator